MLFYDLSPEQALEAYRMGYFPMADSADSYAFRLLIPPKRALLPLEALHVPKSLRKMVLKDEFTIRTNRAFAEVIEACAEETDKRKSTWINQPIKKVFNELHRMGHAHSVECWDGENLMGGIYGLQVGSAFCAESMFSRKPNASKIALVHLCARLSATGFTLLDAQFTNDHLMQFGIFEVTKPEYLQKLETALETNPDFLSVKTDPKTLVRTYLSNIPR